MVTDYIEREALFKSVEDYASTHPVMNDNELFALFCSIPAADVREVVLCRDCKNRFMTPNGWRCHYAEWAIEDDDFCSCGEKREG